MKLKNLSVFVVLVLALAAPLLPATRKEEPSFTGLGSYTRPITTKSPEAQRYFDQGLAFLQGFNHGAAIRSFEQAAALDPSCAMTHWAIALASGPHINFPLVPPPAAERAWRELRLAQEKLTPGASPVERALVEALAQRYADPQPEDRSSLDQAYADAMRRVWQRYPEDPDVGAFFAEALLDLRPWDQWTAEGKPQPGTEEIIATLDAVLKLDVNHPLANHLYVHTLESSPDPGRAAAQADRLRTMMPGLAHMVHMPSHIDVRCGRWQEAIAANVRAVEADRRHRAVAGPPSGFLPVYVAHNRHMLAYAAMMSGQGELALGQIRAMVAEFPEGFIKEYAPLAEGWVAMPLEVMVRFGRWEEILAEPDDYPDYMPFTRAFHSAARALAFSASGKTAEARREQAVYLERAALVPKEETFGNNPVAAILAVVTPMVEGEIRVREGQPEPGLAELRAAVRAEDALHYDEPPGWLIPVRHALAANLMQAKHYAEAEGVYRDDLQRLPENGWSLYGLSQALMKQNKLEESASTVTRFHEVWQKADVQITSSCLCQPDAS